MQRLFNVLRRFAGRLTDLLLLFFVVRRVRDALRRRKTPNDRPRRAGRDVLPSLLDRYPAATAAPRRPVGLRSVPIDRIIGTMRRPSQNTADFLPLPRLRGANWRGRWQRITRALDRLETLPPVDLVQVGDDYYVVDGHNRVAAARRAGGLEVDADVTQLLIPGVTQPGQARFDASSLIGTDEIRQAARGGRKGRSIPTRDAIEDIPRRELEDDAGEHR
ncbi:MAG TPA: hypothetical protein VEW95_07695 [Candidatus Limnocylindrales bacterium]|nr:hypothetical protein [Candidatus Limnocylindrales bacterium]